MAQAAKKVGSFLLDKMLESLQQGAGSDAALELKGEKCYPTGR